MCSNVNGSVVYDLFGYVHPFMTAPHDGMMFSTTHVDNDIMDLYNCAASLGGGWWWAKCALIAFTSLNPTWFSLGDSVWYNMKNIHMMVKLQ